MPNHIFCHDPFFLASVSSPFPVLRRYVLNKRTKLREMWGINFRSTVTQSLASKESTDNTMQTPYTKLGFGTCLVPVESVFAS